MQERRANKKEKNIHVQEMKNKKCRCRKLKTKNIGAGNKQQKIYVQEMKNKKYRCRK